MTKSQQAQYLREIKNNGGKILDNWVMEGLQDLGYIDHRDNLSPAGEEILALIGK